MYVSVADRQIPVVEGTTTIGRGSDAAVQIDAGGVSRYHARIIVSGGQPSIEDLGSKNGTFVGDTRIEGPRALADGDQIRVGPVLITFRVAPATMPTETMSRPSHCNAVGASSRKIQPSRAICSIIVLLITADSPASR